MPDNGKPHLNGNPLNTELQYNGGNFYTRGTPDKSKGESLAKGNQLYKETPYQGKSLIQGNPLHVETLVK